MVDVNVFESVTEHVRRTGTRATRTATFALVVIAASTLPAAEGEYDITVRINRVRQTQREFYLRFEVRGPGGHTGGSSEMRLRPGSAPRSESVSRGPAGTRRRTIRANLNEEGTELWYEIQIIHDDDVVACKSEVVDVSALPKRD